MLRSGKFTWGLMLVEFGWVDTTWQYPQLMVVSFRFDYTFPSFAQKRHCSCNSSGAGALPSQSIYLLYSTISYRNSLIMGVSSQNMEIVVYATENDMPIVVPVFCRSIFCAPMAFFLNWWAGIRYFRPICGFDFVNMVDSSADGVICHESLQCLYAIINVLKGIGLQRVPISEAHSVPARVSLTPVDELGWVCLYVRECHCQWVYHVGISLLWRKWETWPVGYPMLLEIGRNLGPCAFASWCNIQIRNLPGDLTLGSRLPSFVSECTKDRIADSFPMPSLSNLFSLRTPWFGIKCLNFLVFAYASFPSSRCFFADK